MFQEMTGSPQRGEYSAVEEGESTEKNRDNFDIPALAFAIYGPLALYVIIVRRRRGRIAVVLQSTRRHVLYAWPDNNVGWSFMYLQQTNVCLNTSHVPIIISNGVSYHHPAERLQIVSRMLLHILLSTEPAHRTCPRALNVVLLSRVLQSESETDPLTRKHDVSERGQLPVLSESDPVP